ncbi:hypothetical protein HU200_017300 [Digitaria exilis]|uniref:Phenylalanyl-tRNA synthetase domain-containing protein n=1 Tax=Digitaria exilis TaxID=1010633 RepID=A0A835F743_9POAL|nr:hypothetical protein HU200_017300 [Digitaria exilis]
MIAATCYKLLEFRCTVPATPASCSGIHTIPFLRKDVLELLYCLIIKSLMISLVAIKFYMPLWLRGQVALRTILRKYGYDWKRDEAEKNLLRTHTTAKPFAPKRYYSIDRVFRNEAVDRTSSC